jgi:hypothetical protein
VSNFETYQANRLKLRYRNSDNKKQLLHTLNGSALALPRILASILENNQTADGIKVPKALVGFPIETIDQYTGHSSGDEQEQLQYRPALTKCRVLARGKWGQHSVSKVQLQPWTGRRYVYFKSIA